MCVASDFQSLWSLPRVRMRAARIHLQLPEHGVAERPFRQHALYCLLQCAVWMRRLQLREIGYTDAAGKARMAVILLVVSLLAGHPDLRGIDDNDEIPSVDVRGVLGLVLAAQPRRDLNSEAA